MRKADLPQKICPVCARPFSWRKKWEKVWDEVCYCSAKCRSARRSAAGANGRRTAANCPRSLQIAGGHTTFMMTKE